MASINKVILIGNLGGDPEIRYAPSGDAICTLRLATTDKWRDKESGEAREATERHRVVLFRRLAEVASQYLKKGAPVYVEGRLRTRKWQDKEGRERYTTEIEGNEMKMLGAPDSTSSPTAEAKQKRTLAIDPWNPTEANSLPYDPDNLPF